MGKDPRDYYNEIGEEEWERSDENFIFELEHENTREYLEKFLPENGRILDAGGASGKYSIWLAEQGYDVELIDLSDEQIQIAKQKIKEKDLGDKINASTGDIRKIDYRDNSFDAVLCLGGPISHLTDKQDRRNAVRELKRVVKPGSPVFVSVIGFYSVLMLATLKRWGFMWEIEDFMERQKYDKQFLELIDEDEPDFAETFFFKPHQLGKLLRDQNLRVERMVGLQNVASVLEAELKDEDHEGIDEDFKDRLRKASKELAEDPTAVGMSSHILAIAYPK